MKIPTGEWTQTNSGDIFGTLNETHNVVFEKNGHLKLNKKSIAHENEATDFEQVHQIIHFGGDTYLITDGEVFRGNLDGQQFTKVTGSPGLNTTTSAVVFNGEVYVIDGTTVDSYDGSSWTSNQISGLGSESGVAHPMAFFESLSSHQLAIGDKENVRVYNASHSAGTALTIPSNYIVTSLAYRNGYLYVGTKDEDGREALVFVWNGSGSAAQYSIPVGASWIYSLIPYGSTVAGVTNEGEIFAVSGNQKVTLAAFPIYFQDGARWYNGSAATTGEISLHGMSVIGDAIFLMIEGRVDNNGFVPGMMDGVWCYDPSVGLYHYATPTIDTVVKDSSLTRSGNNITTSADHNLKTGDAVQFTSTSGLTGVTNDVVYYAIVVDSDTIQLAGNRYDADQGNVITLGGTPVGTDTLTYVPNTDYGTMLDGNMGALSSTTHRTAMEPLYSTDIIYGAEPKNTSQANVSTVQGFVDAWNVGWFTTQKIFASNVSQSWLDLNLFLNGNLLSIESIVVKYKKEERASLPTENVNCTWSDGDTLTTTNLKVNASNVVAGDEIMVVSGRGQGRLAHITSISESGGTVTINIDESIGNASDTCDIVVTGFKKIKEFTGNDRTNRSRLKAAINVNSPWIQIKIEMRGYGIEIFKLELTNKVYE